MCPLCVPASIRGGVIESRNADDSMASRLSGLLSPESECASDRIGSLLSAASADIWPFWGMVLARVLCVSYERHDVPDAFFMVFRASLDVMCPGGSILHDSNGGNRDRSLRRWSEPRRKVQPQQSQVSLRLIGAKLIIRVLGTLSFPTMLPCLVHRF